MRRRRLIAGVVIALFALLGSTFALFRISRARCFVLVGEAI
jgi:hypothetical protein